MKRMLLLGMTVACAEAAPPEVRAPSTASAKSRLVEIRPAAGQLIFEAPATTVGDPESAAQVNVPYPALVRQILVTPGDVVVAGAPLAKVVVPELNQAAAELLASESQRTLVKARLQSLTGLKAEGLVREEQLYELQARLADLEARRDQALVKLAAVGLGPNDARALIDRGLYFLKAPIAGTVIESSLVLGAYWDPGQGALAKLQGRGAQRLEVLLTQSLPPSAQLVFRDLSGRDHPVRPAPLSRVSSPGSGVERVWLALSDSAPLSPGLRGALRVEAPEAGYWIVPGTAVFTKAGRSTVWVADGEVLRRVDVEVLSTSGANAVVRGELQPGARVSADASLAQPEGES